MRIYKPIDIARELQISTSALRHYESWGVVPTPDRSTNGYRIYTEVHLAYFRCLRALYIGFGFSFASKVLQCVQEGDADTALWMVNKEQSMLQNEKKAADQTLLLLQNPKLDIVDSKKMKPLMTIGEATALTNVNASAIRHWEKEGLITPERNQENGYRQFTPIHIRQIMLIRSLRKTVYFLEHMKELVHAVELQNIEQVKKVAEKALSSINGRNRMQYLGVHRLIELCGMLRLVKKK